MFGLDIWTLLVIIWKVILYLSCFYAVGSILFLYFLKPVDEAIGEALLKSTTFLVAVAFLFTLTLIPLQAGQLMDDGWSGVFDGDIMKIISEGPTGITVLIRSVGLTLLLFTTLRGLPISWAGLIGAVLVAISFAFSGHATGEPRIILSLLITIHVLTTSYWLGVLHPLHRMAEETSRLAETAHLAEKFGKQATTAVPVLLLVGIILAWLLVGTFPNLFLTTYGQVLLAKVTVVSLLLILATRNKLSYVPAMLSGKTNAAAQLRRSIQLEALCFLLVFVSVAVLTGGPDLPDH